MIWGEKNAQSITFKWQWKSGVMFSSAIIPSGYFSAAKRPLKYPTFTIKKKEKKQVHYSPLSAKELESENSEKP